MSKYSKTNCTLGRSLTNNLGEKYWDFYMLSNQKKKNQAEKNIIQQNTKRIIQNNELFLWVYQNWKNILKLKKINYITRVCDVVYNGKKEKWDLLFLIETIKKFYILKK